MGKAGREGGRCLAQVAQVEDSSRPRASSSVPPAPTSGVLMRQTDATQSRLQPNASWPGSLFAFVQLIRSPDRTTDQLSLPPCQCARPGGLRATPSPQARPRKDKGRWPGREACVRTAASPRGRQGARLPGGGRRMKSELWREIYCTIKEEWPALGTIRATLLWNYRGRPGN